MAVKATTAPVVQGGFIVGGGEEGGGQPIFVNRVEMPPAPHTLLQAPFDAAKFSESKSGGPTPIGKRQLDQGSQTAVSNLFGGSK